MKYALLAIKIIENYFKNNRKTMPERAEIAIMADLIRDKVNGKKCEKIVILPTYNKNEFYSSMSLNYIQYKNVKYVDIGLNLLNVFSRGKKIIFDFNNYRFVSGCGMTGKWSYQVSINTKIILMFEDTNIYYDEVKIGGNFSVCAYPSNEYNHIFKDVGPDLMTDEVNWEIYYRIIKDTSDMKICDFMMEQKYMSGIGAYLRAEILYYSKICPYRLLSSLSNLDIYNLFYYSKTIIFESYRCNGLTIQDYVSPDGKMGTYLCKCYGRKSDDNSFQIIIQQTKGDRVIHWCPDVQV